MDSNAHPILGMGKTQARIVDGFLKLCKVAMAEGCYHGKRFLGFGDTEA